MLNNNEIKDTRTLEALGGRKVTTKKKAFLFDDAPPIRITYDTVPSVQQWRAQFEENQPVVYDEKAGNIPPPPPLNQPVVYDERTGNIPPPPPLQKEPAPVQPPLDANGNPVKYNFDYDSKLTEEDLVRKGERDDGIVRQLEDRVRDEGKRGGRQEERGGVREGGDEVQQGEEEGEAKESGGEEGRGRGGRGREGRLRYVQSLRRLVQVVLIVRPNV